MATVAATTTVPVLDHLNLVQHLQLKCLSSAKKAQNKNLQRNETCLSLPVSLVIPVHVSHHIPLDTVATHP